MLPKPHREKSEVTKIEFLWSESAWFHRRFRGAGFTVKSWSDADSILRQMSENFGPVPGGYDKTDFRATWEDGTVHQGRYDVHHYAENQEHRNGSQPSLAQHICDFCEYTSRRWLPPWIAEKYGDDARHMVDRWSQSTPPELIAHCEHVLDHCQLGDTELSTLALA